MSYSITPTPFLPPESPWSKLVSCVPLIGIHADAREHFVKAWLVETRTAYRYHLHHYEFTALIRKILPIAIAIFQIFYCRTLPIMGGLPVLAAAIIPIMTPVKTSAWRERIALGFTALGMAAIHSGNPTLSIGMGLVLGASLRTLPDIIREIFTLQHNLQHPDSIIFE